MPKSRPGVSPFTRVFVMYPRGQRSGGPEALHQLVDSLRSLGIEALLVAIEGTADAPRVAAYDHYDAPEAARVEDAVGNAVIVPETLMGRLLRIRRAQPIVWWLSIDNSTRYFPLRERADRRFGAQFGIRHVRWSPSVRVAFRHRLHALLPLRRALDRSLHLAQSMYARAYLQSRLDLGSALVTDYIPAPETWSAGALPPSKRPPSVAFNPQKSPWVPDLLGPLLPGIRWNRLAGLDSRGVAEVLGGSAVYFDPGFHPGRDRMPREAALSGAVTVVARRGAGAYWQDVPIEDRFKVSPRAAFVNSAVSCMRDALDDLPGAVAAQDGYRRWISTSRERFITEVERAFIALRWEDDMPVLVPA